MQANILCTLLAQRIPPEQFQVHGQEVVFLDSNKNNKPCTAPNESPYNTPKNRAIVEDVIKNYKTLAAKHVSQQEATDIYETAIKAKEAEILRRQAVAELEAEQVKL